MINVHSVINLYYFVLIKSYNNSQLQSDDEDLTKSLLDKC